VKNRREQGIALITTLLILLLLSTMIVGIAWLVTGDQKLGGNNSDRQLAFYGAEAGMESLTASLENLFDSNPAPNAAAINALMTTPGPPANIPNVQYIAPGTNTPGSGYQISFTPNPTNASLPNSSVGTIPNGDNGAGLYAVMTPYTLTVTAKTVSGSEVRLQRVVQTVAIPVFEFGFFSQMDLSFFAGPNFNFGGRVHTNGNLWLQEGTGSTLTMSQKVTAAGEIITKNLENGWLTNTNYNGTVNITNGSGVSNLIVQAPQQSVLGTNNSYPAGTAIGPPTLGAYDTTFKAMANSVYNNNIGVAETGVKPLDVSIATPGIGGQPIDLIRRPQPNENTANNAKFVERYYGNPGLSLRILLSDYGADGTCTSSDINSAGTNPMPNLSPGAPVDLATLAFDTSATAGGGAPPYNAAPAWIPAASVGKTVFPLPVSGAKAASAYISSGAGYSGYWIQQYYPVITGCIKIEYQSGATPGTYVDVTQEILKLGFTGRNIDPQVNRNNVPAFVPYTLPLATGVQMPSLIGPTVNGQVAASGPTPNTAVTTVGCQDPSPNAIIRLARLRDNPSTAASGNNYCGNNDTSEGNTSGTWSGLSTKSTTCSSGWPTDPTNCPSTHGTDYWPNALYDTREAVTRDAPLAPGNVPAYTLSGTMYYVELDVANLMKWFAGTIAGSGTNAVNTQGYGVYFSDRRGDRPDNQSPPPSVGPSPILTGGYGYEDFVNGSGDVNGCPDNLLEQGEDVEGDYTNGVDSTPVLKRYGGTPTFPNATWAGWTIAAPANVLVTNPNCAGTIATPMAVVASGGSSHPQELRENPPLLFRRALKLVHGDTLLPGTPPTPTCSSVPCGLTIASENPVYVQGCYNNPGQCNMASSTSWSTNSVASSVVADALTFLSDNWNDVNSFTWPYGVYNSTANPRFQVGQGGRNAVTTTYRLAVAAGKGIPFKQPTFAGVGQDFGTDGGAHNFLRYIENWGPGTLYYEGSIVSLYYNHQAEGVYKCCTVVYDPPGRGYTFDSNFLTPSLLPPLTPMLRTINTIGFTQMLLPTQ